MRKGKGKSSRSVVSVIGGVLLLGGTAAWEFGPPLAGCSVKGNISVNSGERIYHVPGQRYYVATRLDPFTGERWFCSEADARAAGWRRSME